jgi:hypothetical protein
LFFNFRINQYIGHNISLKSSHDFWFKESLAIYLAYEINSQLFNLPIEEFKIKNDLIKVKFYFNYLMKK